MVDSVIRQVVEAENQVKTIISNAKEEAQAILLASNSEVDKIKAEAREQTREKIKKLEEENKKKIEKYLESMDQSSKEEAEKLKVEILSKVQEKSDIIFKEILKDWQ